MANIVFGFQGGSEKKEEPKKKGLSSLFGSLNKVVEQVSAGVNSLSQQSAVNNKRMQLIDEVRNGNVESALRLHDMYANGEGVEINPMEAWFWVRTAGDMGSARGDYLTGVCFRDGIGVGRDILKAFAYFERAGRRGSQEGNGAWNDIMREQVNFYTNTRNLSWEELRQVAQTDPNPVNRYECNALMAQMDEDRLGKNWVALDYLHGRGTQRNYIAAVYWFNMAMNAGNEYAFYNLGTMYESGLGVLVDYDKAIELYSYAAERGNGSAKQRLNVLKERNNASADEISQMANAMGNGSGNGYVQYQMYYHFMLLGAQRGNVFCYNNLAFCYQTMYGTQRDYIEALYYLGKTCLVDVNTMPFDMWHGTAYETIAEMIALGQGIPLDMEKAEFYYNEAKKYSSAAQIYPTLSECFEAAKEKSKESPYREAQFLFQGQYCNPDTARAIEMYKECAGNKDIEAHMELAMIYEQGIAVPRDLNLAWDYIQQAESLSANSAYVDPYKAGVLLGQMNHVFPIKMDVIPFGNAIEEAEEAYSCGAKGIAHGFIEYVQKRGGAEEQARAKDVLAKWEAEERPPFLDENGCVKEDEIHIIHEVSDFEDKVFEEIKQLKEAEDYDAIYELGIAYANGDDRERNGRIAVYCFMLGIEQEDERAMYSMALCFMYGQGVPTNFELAERMINSLSVIPDYQDMCETALNEILPEAKERDAMSLLNTYELLRGRANAHAEVYRPEEAWVLYEYFYHADCKRRMEMESTEGQIVGWFNKDMPICVVKDNTTEEPIPYEAYKVNWEGLIANCWWEREENEVENEGEVAHLGASETQENDTDNIDSRQLPDNLDPYFEGMIGMDSVKEQLNKIYQSVKMQLLRDEILRERGEEPLVNEKGYNFILLGNPGTGKTTVARIIAKILYDIQVRTSDSFIEIERSGVVGDHIGGTEKRMKEILEKVNGGTLFIDEAYALYREDSDNDFGQEAIDVLMKDMEDHRNSYSVIMAGYKEPMLNMIRHANSGFSSRFSYTIELPDYSDEALIEIAHMHMDKQKFVAEEGVDAAIKKCIAHDKLDNTFGNARYIRELVHRAIENQSHRLNEQGDYAQEELFLLKAVDFWKGELEERTIEYYMDQLHQLTGLDEVKKEVKSLVNQVTVQKELEKRGIVDVTETGTLHMAFKGNPGTGKTTVARLIGKIYASLGVLKRGDVFVECTRADLVGKYQGHTAANVKKVVESALGGVLFIDEAYALVQGDGDSFGKEAVDTLVAEIENNRKNLVIIFAGYTHDLDEFFKNNAGLRSRVPKDLFFEDYNLEELYEIALQMLSAQKMRITEDAKQTIRMRLLKETHSTDFGNARGVRNMVEDMKRKQNVRVADLLLKGVDTVSDIQLLTIEAEDVIES